MDIYGGDDDSNVTLNGWAKRLPPKYEDKIWVNWIGNNNAYKGNRLSVNYPIALLIGRNTNSAGEAIAATFQGKTNVKSFGKPTAGKFSGNMPYEIAPRLIVVVTEVIGVTTDLACNPEENSRPDVDSDRPTIEAKKWIRDSLQSRKSG